jgi:hypothetical protein
VIYDKYPFRRRCEALQHGVLVQQLRRPIWQTFIEQAALEGALSLPGYARGGQAKRREYLAVKWIPQGWQWVDPKKEFDAMLTAIRRVCSSVRRPSRPLACFVRLTMGGRGGDTSGRVVEFRILKKVT